MSDVTQAAVGSEPNDALDALEIETPGGRSATIEVTGTPTNHHRVDVRVDGGRQWVFGVNDDVAKLLLVLNENEQRIDATLPAWIEPVVQRLGLAGVVA